MTMISDGTGSGYKVGINSNNQLKTVSESQSAYQAAVADGRAFNLNANNLQVSAVSGEQAILYVKNTGTQNLNLVNLFGSVWDRTAGTSDTNVFRIVANPIGGTIISDANTVAVPNRAIGSANVFDDEITAYYASGGGKTLTGQSSTPNAFITHASGRLFVGIDLVLPPGQALGITVDTFGGDFKYYIGFAGYVDG